MTNKKLLLGVLVVVLVFSVLMTGCASLFKKAPGSFVQGSGGETTVLLRQGLDFEQAFREIIFILSRHGFEPEMMNNEAGYIRTRWNTTWYSQSSDSYRVRILVNFNPSRTQVIINAPAEYSSGGSSWKVGYDTRAIETLRIDISQSIGN